MKYLVDANVLSEPTKPMPDRRVLAWLRGHERDLAVDPVILGELEIRDSDPSEGTEEVCIGALVRGGCETPSLFALGR